MYVARRLLSLHLNSTAAADVALKQVSLQYYFVLSIAILSCSPFSGQILGLMGGDLDTKEQQREPR